MVSELSDQSGNKLFFDGSFVRLRLATENRVRTLGEVRGDTLYTVRNLENHEMHNRKEIGFNLTLMTYGAFRNVVVTTRGGREFLTTRKWILEYGHKGRPGRRDFDVQVFLSLDKFCGLVDPPLKTQEVFQEELF